MQSEEKCTRKHVTISENTPAHESISILFFFCPYFGIIIIFFPAIAALHHQAGVEANTGFAREVQG